MTVTQNTLKQVNSFTWNVSWESDIADTFPLYQVYVNGVLYQETFEKSINYTVDLNESPVFHVYDNLTDRPPYVVPDRFTIPWQTQYFPPADINGIDYFLVQEYDDGEWVDREKIIYDRNLYYTYITRVLEDQTVFTFKITPYGVNGGAGTPSYYSALMVKYPPPPIPTMVYSSIDAKVTITI